jgi:hypothetical protein
MTSSKRRLDKLEVFLTPKQAILLWMEEAHRYDTMEQYVRSLKPGPDSAWPLATLPDKVATAVEQAMKGRPKPEVARVARQAIRDVLFLFHLHEQVNRRFIEEDRHFWTRALLLSTELDALRRERSPRDQLSWSWFRVGMELPYPLDPETASAVDAAREHHVLPWELLENGDGLTGWVQEYFVTQGKSLLPDGAYSLRQSSNTPSTSGPSEEEVRALFSDETEFQKFLSGEDYSYGLADVPDQEFEARWDSVLQAIKALVSSGEVQEGVVVELPTVPHNLLRDAPLVEEVWLDRYVGALAEWGARLQAKGYQLEEPEDSHPLAWYRIVDPETGTEGDAGVLKKLWQQTEKHLGRFPGRARDIQGRPYLHLQDYLRWRGRKARGGVESGLRRGLLPSSWNQWMAATGGHGAVGLEGVKVDRLSCYLVLQQHLSGIALILAFSQREGGQMPSPLRGRAKMGVTSFYTNAAVVLDGYRYHPCLDWDEAAEEQRQRESLLLDLRGWKPGRRSYDRYHRRIGDWKEMAANFLCELYSLHQAADTISQRYFDGRQLLFPASASGFAKLVESMEELVQGFNEDFGYKCEQEVGPAPGSLDGAKPPDFIDIATVQQAVVPAVRQHTTFLVDMAKAEVLDAMGENRAAMELMDLHT